MESHKSITSGPWTVYTHPFSSAAGMLAIAFITMLALRHAAPTLPWEVCCVAMLFFAVYNQVRGLLLRRWPLYMGLSYLAFAIYTALLLTTASLLAEVPLSGLVSLKKTYVLLVVFFIMLTILASVYRVALLMLESAKR